MNPCEPLERLSVLSRKRNDVEGVFEKNPGSGVWYIRVRANGKNLRRKIGDRIEAEKALAAVHLAKKTNAPIVNLSARGATVERLCDAFLEFCQNPSNPSRPKDITNLISRLAFIQEKFGARVASTIQPAEIRRWLVEMNRNPATLNRYRSVLSSIYRHGKEEGIISVNPVRDLKQFRVEMPTPRWLREDEEERIREVLAKWIAEAKGRRKMFLEFHPHELTFALDTGLRKSNQYALRVDKHIDMPTRYIRLPAAMTKTGKPLEIPMSDRIVDSLADLKRIRQLLSDKTNEDRLVDDGRVFMIRENREWWSKALKEAEVEDIRWHDLRHTFATRLVQRGVHLSIVQKLCGHRSITTTMRYAHADDSSMRDAVNSLKR